MKTQIVDCWETSSSNRVQLWLWNQTQQALTKRNWWPATCAYCVEWRNIWNSTRIVKKKFQSWCVFFRIPLMNASTVSTLTSFRTTNNWHCDCLSIPHFWLRERDLFFLLTRETTWAIEMSPGIVYDLYGIFGCESLFLRKSIALSTSTVLPIKIEWMNPLTNCCDYIRTKKNTERNDRLWHFEWYFVSKSIWFLDFPNKWNNEITTKKSNFYYSFIEWIT